MRSGWSQRLQQKACPGFCSLLAGSDWLSSSGLEGLWIDATTAGSDFYGLSRAAAFHHRLGLATTSPSSVKLRRIAALDNLFTTGGKKEGLCFLFG